MKKVKRAAVKKESAQLVEHLPTMVKLLQSISQQIRFMASAIYATWFVPVESVLMHGVKDEMNNYSAAVQREGKEHKEGPPHLHALLGFLAESQKVHMDQVQLDYINKLEKDLESMSE